MNTEKRQNVMNRSKPKALWKVIFLDLLVGALTLGLVVFFQIGLPFLQGKLRSADLQAAREAAQAVPPAVSVAPVTATPSPVLETPAVEIPAVQSAAESTPEPTAEPTPEPTPDTRTPWQIRFADQFTDEVVITENSYTSPQVSIHVETKEFGEGYDKSVYHVADIYVASLDNFRTYTAYGQMEPWVTQDPMEMDADAHAILAISGDYFCYQSFGFLVRNGQVYRGDQTYCDLCVLYENGEMACYRREDYLVEDIMRRGVVQAWNFGPSLLDEDGKLEEDYMERLSKDEKASVAIAMPNPRSAVGYYEPGHYVFVVVDGRQEGYSKGMTIPELASVFRDLGCKVAYNLDGGGSALMTFLHERYSNQSNLAERELGDMLIVTETGWEDKR